MGQKGNAGTGDHPAIVNGWPGKTTSRQHYDAPHSAGFLLVVVLILWTAGCAGPPLPAAPETGLGGKAPIVPTAPAGETRSTAIGPVVAALTPLPSATRHPEPTRSPAVTSIPLQSSSDTPQRTPTGVANQSLEQCSALPSRTNRPAYHFRVEADPPGHELRVQQQLGLADPARLATGEILFNVPANHSPGTFLLKSAQLAGFDAPPKVESDGTLLRLLLPPSARTAASLTVCLGYTVELPPAAGTGLSGDNALSWSDLGLVAGYWYPVLAPYRSPGGWITVPYHPVGDPIVFETAEYSVEVSAPPGYTVIGAGLAEATGGIWRFRLERGRGFAFVVSDRLSATKALADDIPVWVYHQPQHETAALDASRAAVEAMALFVDTYGPYPYDQLIIVEAPQFGGMEYSGLITFSSAAFEAYQPPVSSPTGKEAPGEEFGARFLLRFIVHEIGHQWWYGAVGNDQAREPWLDEAMARYGEWLYYDRLHPGNLGWWEAPSAGMATAPINQPIYNFADTAGYVQAVYVSGTRFLLAVREEIGEPAFRAFLRRYYEENRDRLVSQAEFLALLRTYTGPALDALLPIYFDPIPEE